MTETSVEVVKKLPNKKETIAGKPSVIKPSFEQTICSNALTKIGHTTPLTTNSLASRQSTVVWMGIQMNSSISEVWLYPSEEQEAMYKKATAPFFHRFSCFFLSSIDSFVLKVLEQSEVIREACNKSKLGIEASDSTMCFLTKRPDLRFWALIAM